MRTNCRVLGIQAILHSFWLPAALAQTGPTPEDTWRLMLSAKYGRTEPLSKFVVVERARSGETLTYAHRAGTGWWMCFDNRPRLHMARLEVVNTAQREAQFSWISRGPEPSRVLPFAASEEQRTLTLAIFDPGSAELGAVPSDASVLPNGTLVVTVHAGSEILRYELDRVSHLPTQITVSIPYHKLFLRSPDREPGAMTSSVLKMGNYAISDGGGNQPRSINLRGTNFTIEFQAGPKFPDGLFSLPIEDLFQTPDAWR